MIVELVLARRLDLFVPLGDPGVLVLVETSHETCVELLDVFVFLAFEYSLIEIA